MHGPRSRAQDALTEEELEALLAAVETRSPTGKRNLALLTLMADTGLRIGEALALHTGDVVREAGQIMGVKVRAGKGGRPAELAMSRRAAARLAAWLAARENLGLGAGPIFCTVSRGQRARGRTSSEGFTVGTEVVRLEPGKPLAPEYVRQFLTRLAQRAGIERRVTPHTLRHTFATHLLRATGNLKLVQQALRHADVTTTARVYSHLQAKDVAEAVRALRDGESPVQGEAQELAAQVLAALPSEVRVALAEIIADDGEGKRARGTA